MDYERRKLIDSLKALRLDCDFNKYSIDQLRIMLEKERTYRYNLCSEISTLANSEKGYEILRDAEEPFAWMMYRKATQIAREIAFGMYKQGNVEMMKKYLKQMNEYFYNYLRIHKDINDIGFCIKKMYVSFLIRISIIKKGIKSVKW